ncbi:MAG: hypothetical protein IPK20_21855 [Betaproteobacteria bacterium]|nr:hypothetical protein [Betaproteobacteria bacterium]
MHRFLHRRGGGSDPSSGRLRQSSSGKAGETPPGPSSGKPDVEAPFPAILPAESVGANRPLSEASPVSPPAPAREAESGRLLDPHATAGTLAAVRQFQAGHADVGKREKAASIVHSAPAEAAYPEVDEFRALSIVERQP